MVCHRVNVGINILNIKDRLWMSVRDKILEIFAGLKWEFGGGEWCSSQIIQSTYRHN